MEDQRRIHDQEKGEQSPGGNFFNRKISRRSMIPGTGLLDLAKASGNITGLSKESQVSLAKDVVLAAAMVGSANRLMFSESDNRSMKEKIISFSWEDTKDKEKLKQFSALLADEYLKLTQTKRVTKEDLVGDGRTNFFSQTKDYVDEVRKVVPSYSPSATQWGYTHYDSKKVFLDLEKMKQQALENSPSAGLAIINGLWHEWGHLDVERRTQGELLNNPQFFFESPVSRKNEQFNSYRGGAIYTDTYYGFLRFEEVWNETITVRRLVEQVGLTELISARDYYSNGVDFFPRLTNATAISLDELYQMHATSDFEGFAKRIGEKLPGPGASLAKGVNLFIGIHQADSQLIQRTGVFNVSGMR